VQLADAHV